MQNTNAPITEPARVKLRDEAKADDRIEKKVTAGLNKLLASVDGPYGKDDAQCIALSILHAEVIRRMVATGQISSLEEAATNAVGVAAVLLPSEHAAYWEKQQIAREFRNVARGPESMGPVQFDFPPQ